MLHIPVNILLLSHMLNKSLYKLINPNLKNTNTSPPTNPSNLTANLTYSKEEAAPEKKYSYKIMKDCITKNSDNPLSVMKNHSIQKLAKVVHLQEERSKNLGKIHKVKFISDKNIPNATKINQKKKKIIPFLKKKILLLPLKDKKLSKNIELYLIKTSKDKKGFLNMQTNIKDIQKDLIRF